MVWGDSFSESDNSEKQEDASMIVVKDDVQIYDSLFALLAKSDEDEDEKVTLLDIKGNIKDYSPKGLKYFSIVLIDIVCELTKDKESLSKILINLK